MGFIVRELLLLSRYSTVVSPARPHSGHCDCSGTDNLFRVRDGRDRLSDPPTLVPDIFVGDCRPNYGCCTFNRVAGQ